MAQPGMTDLGRIVVIDASPLIGLAIIDGFKWLPNLLTPIYLPESVRREVLPGRNATGERQITDALQEGSLHVWPKPIDSLIEIDLDPGETDCINLALHHLDHALLIMDERAGRAVAREKGIRLAGTAAIIESAKKKNLIPSAKAAFEALHDHDFRIAPAIIKDILVSVGEL